MYYKVTASKLQGTIKIPPSKSHTMRAILFASLANGQSMIHNYLHSPDTEAMISACRQMGAQITVSQDLLIIVGVNGKLKTPDNIIDAGNSGQVLRFIGAIAGLTPAFTIITGDHSIRSNRPIEPLLEGLRGLGATALSSKLNGYAPIMVQGPLLGGTTHLDGTDSQPVSGLLIAAAFAPKESTINVNNPGEKPWIDLTLSWFDRLGIKYKHTDYKQYIIYGHSKYDGFEYHVPGDFSSCAFPLAAAIITNSCITLENLDLDDSQGDKALINTIQAMGGLIAIDKNNKSINTHGLGNFLGQEIDINNYIDALPILAVLGCFAQGNTIITNAAIARKKESDRLATITQELRKMGADIEEYEDSLKITCSPLTGAQVDSYNDHRIAMALTVAGLTTKHPTRVNNVECISKSYPNFLTSLHQLGAQIEVGE